MSIFEKSPYDIDTTSVSKNTLITSLVENRSPDTPNVIKTETTVLPSIELVLKDEKCLTIPDFPCCDDEYADYFYSFASLFLTRTLELYPKFPLISTSPSYIYKNHYLTTECPPYLIFDDEFAPQMNNIYVNIPLAHLNNKTIADIEDDFVNHKLISVKPSQILVTTYYFDDNTTATSQTPISHI